MESKKKSKSARCNLCCGMTCECSLPEDIPDKVSNDLLQRYCNEIGGICVRKDRGVTPKWKRVK